ncbi:MAG: serine hydrolase domain-containing protein [Chloroflexota bacterium]
MTSTDGMGPVIAAVRAAAETHLAGGPAAGLAVAIVRDGKPAWSGGFGMADPATGRPMTPDTLLRIASVTKTFTATAVLQLRDEGRISLEDPLVAHVPEARRIVDPFGTLERITVRQVLLHVAGLEGGEPIADPRQPAYPTFAELLARIDELRLTRPPDVRWSYANAGYELLAILVERVSGEPYAERLARTVLAPAGLADTTYAPHGAQAARCALGQTPGAEPGTWRAAAQPPDGTLLGDGGLWSTADDLARWLAVQCDLVAGRGTDGAPPILTAASRREMGRPVALVDVEGWATAQALGWAAFRVDDRGWEGHTGSLPGYRAIAIHRPADGLGVVALSLGHARPNAVAFAAARALWTARPEPVPAPVVEPARPPYGPGPLGPWIALEFGDSLEVREHDGGLELSHGGTWQRMVPAGAPGRWRVADEDATPGELVVHVPDEGPGLPETLSVAGWPLRRPGA